MTAMKHLEPKAAHEFLKKNPNSVFIDCRSEMEYLFVGHPAGAILVPWNDGPNWERKNRLAPRRLAVGTVLSAARSLRHQEIINKIK